jgi:hypothetical protein
MKMKDNEQDVKKISFLQITILMLMIILGGIVLLATVSAQAQESFSTWCAERTTSGAYCQNVPFEQVDENYLSSPTSCDQTSFCARGCCYDSDEGLCSENVPERVCSESNGIWSDSPNCQIPQCELGCCVLGNEAAFTSLQRCKKLAGNFGLNADFRTDIGDEISCIALATSQDQGACVFETEFTRTCKFGTRGECDASLIEGLTNENVEFYQDFLCTSEELNTNCQRTRETSCFEGKDEVYFLDSCGNQANIYDSSKVDDTSYWNKVVPIGNSCGSGKGNANSRSCGNCDYLGGSICAKAERGSQPSYGDYICNDLNCYDTINGNDYRNGESWCVFDQNDDLVESVGSRYFRHTCFVGEETIEACSDFRQQVCIESTIGEEEDFSQAGCVVNRWQDCIIQGEEDDCLNTDQRDCKWIEESVEGSQFSENRDSGKCVPLISPGLQFWDESALTQCEIGSQVCVVKYEKKLIGGKKCVENCHCLEEDWENQALNICTSLGDCGADYNYIGVFVDEGYNTERRKASKSGSATGNVIQGLVIDTYNKMKGG